MIFILCAEAIAITSIMTFKIQSIGQQRIQAGGWPRPSNGITALNDVGGGQARFFLGGTAKRVAQTLQSTVST